MGGGGDVKSAPVFHLVLVHLSSSSLCCTWVIFPLLLSIVIFFPLWVFLSSFAFFFSSPLFSSVVQHLLFAITVEGGPRK
jgi:hypothetical protein